MGGIGSGRWHEHTAKPTVEGVEGHIRVSDYCRLYEIEPGTQEAEDFSLTWTPCHYGGWRAWFVCPECGKRVGILYLGERFLRCRACSGLAYACQRQKKAERLMAKGRKLKERIQQRLPASERQPLTWDAIPPRPRGMWGTTYARTLQQARQASEEGLCMALENVMECLHITTETDEQDQP